MIHGITPSLAEGGKIKIGGLGEARKSKSGKTYRVPKKLDHFLVTKTARDDKGDLELNAEIMAALGKDKDGKIRAIPVVFHSDEIDEVFPTSYALYAGKRLACRGDGQAATRWQIDDKGVRTGESGGIDCPCPYLKADKGPICKPHGTLHCSIALPGIAVAGAVHKWRTTSIISIQRMIGSLQQILSLCGTLRGVPLWLLVDPITVTPPGLKATTVYCCHVELRAKDVLAVQRKALRLAEMRRALQGGEVDGVAYKALLSPPAGDQETVEEQEEVAMEFHPEAAEPIVMIEPPKRKGEASAPAKSEPEAPAETPPETPEGNGPPIYRGAFKNAGSKKTKKGGRRYHLQGEDGKFYHTFSDSVAAYIKEQGFDSRFVVEYNESNYGREIQQVVVETEEGTAVDPETKEEIPF